MTQAYRIIIFLSGHGSILQAIINTIAEKRWPIEIVAVISNKPNAQGLARAQAANIPTYVFCDQDYENSEACEVAMQSTIDPLAPDLLVLAGYMRILHPEFVNHYAGQIINIHPSLLPKFTGLHTFERVLAAGETEHGTTIHFVNNKLDEGPIIAQEKVAIDEHETVDSLREKVQKIERELYPNIIHAFSQGKITPL